MKEYQELHLQSISIEKYAQCKAVSYGEASQVLGICSLTSVMLQNKDNVVVEKERVWMSAGGNAWMRTSAFGDVATTKGIFQNLPVIRQSRLKKMKAIGLDEAKLLLGACSVAKVYLCDDQDKLVKDEHGALACEFVWLSLSGTYWGAKKRFVDQNVGLVL